jgi:Tol biopolymer transport system component
MVYSYAWSPNGRLIAYLDQHFSLWLVHPDGTGRRQLSHLRSWGLSWSPDSTKVVISSPGFTSHHHDLDCTTTSLYVVPIDGAPPKPLRAAGRHVGCGVAWSPRGDEIAYDNDGGVWAIRPDGTKRRHILPKGGGAQWSSDGAQLVFGVVIRLRNGITNRHRAFAVVNPDGTHFHVVTRHAYVEYPEAWSPTGRQILYGAADRHGIYTIGSDGRRNRRVTRDSPPQAGWGALAWSPDGRSIAYTTGETGNTDIYVIGIDGRGKVRLTNTPDIDIDPSWVAR